MVSITSIILEKDEILVKKKLTAKRPNFYMVGNGTMSKRGIKAVDLLDEIMKMTKAEQYVIRVIKEEITYYNTTGEVAVATSALPSDTCRTTFKNGFKLLCQKDLVRRTKRGHYMINPNALIPIEYDEALTIWNKNESKE
jgi:hypothetical protein